MKHLLKSLIILFAIVVSGCDNDSKTIECFTPPSTFSFEIVDKYTGENLFTTGKYDDKKLTITDLSDSKNDVQFNFISENKENIITLRNVGWKTETINYSINVSGNSVFEFHVKANRISGDCSYTEFTDFSIRYATYEVDQSRGVYKILIDTKL